MDLSDFLNQFLGGQKPSDDDKEYENLKPLLTPSLAEVQDIRAAVLYFSSMGTFVAKHNAFCHDPDCGYNFGPARFADPDLFQAMITSRLNDIKASEASSLIQLWATMDASEIEKDPRYIAFRSAHDSLMVVVYATKASLNDPFEFKRR